MSQQQRKAYRFVHRWPIQKTFSRSLCGKFIEGTLSLLFSYENDMVSFKWNEGKVKSKTPEVNFVVDLNIEGGECGEILLDETWKVNNLRCKSAVDLVYPTSIEPWSSWTRVCVKVRSLTRVGHTGKAALSRCIAKRQFQRPASFSAATNVDPKLQSGGQSDLIKPVVKPEQIKSTEGQVELRSPLSAGSFEPPGQPPVKRQKLREIDRQSRLLGDKSKVEENLRAQLVELKKICQEGKFQREDVGRSSTDWP